MKKLTVFVVMASLLFFCSSIANAWTVTIVNNSDVDVFCKIKGEHLFWVQTDCTKLVYTNSTGSCEMPAGICPSGGNIDFMLPVGIHHDYGRLIHDHDLPGGVKCWNSTLTIEHLLNINWQ